MGLIACASGSQAGGQTLANLRAITHALRSWPTPLGAAVNASKDSFDSTGVCSDPRLQTQLETIGRQVVWFAHMRMLWERTSCHSDKAR